MANFRALTLQNGHNKRQQDADDLIVGAGITTAAGALALNSATGAVNVAANANLTALAGTSAFDLSAATGLFSTPTGAVTIGPGAVGISGAASLTAAGTALSVTNNATVGGTLGVTGALSADGGLDRSAAAVLAIGGTNATAINIGKVGALTTILGDLQVDGVQTFVGGSTFSANAIFNGNVTFGDAATDTVSFTSKIATGITFTAAAAINSDAGALTINGTLAIDGATATVQAGRTLDTTGTGNINLPSNGSARFNIESVAVGATVTALNLDTLTDGSDASALHTHGVSTISGTSGEALDAGELVSIADVVGVPKVFKADADGTGTTPNGFAIVTNTVAGVDLAVTLQTGGEIVVADLQWDVVPVVGDVGKEVFMSTTPGNVTITAPAVGSVRRVGFVTVGGVGAVKIAISIGNAIDL